jgi:type VI secretion system secreted protein VgrG
MAIDQATRLLNLQTPLGENELVLTSFSGREEMSRLFQFQLDMISDNNAITAADIVGKNITFSVVKQDDSPRHFNGFVSRFFAGDEDVEGRREYRAEVVPWLWFLTRTTDCRIFQNKKSTDIIEQIFQDLGFSDFEIQAKGNHPQREYCVQYRETDFNFVSRLMEEEGIFYYFAHEDGKHTLKIADSKSAYVDCEEKEVDYPKDRGSEAMEDHILSWEHRYEFRTGKVAHTDYNFKTPSTSLMTNEQTVMKLPGVSKYEFYDYPGLYGTTGDGQPLAKVRMEEEEAEHDVVDATGLCKTFTPGGKFTIREHVSSSEEGKKFVITSIEHVAYEPRGYETGTPEGPEYRNQFTCIPDSVTFRPARLTQKPFVRGPQTALVTGPAGEEIYPDEFGRVKVQFPWDREGKKDENSSCWVRVSQVHAGKGFGGIDIPRIGEEVIVDFLEGDPDQPIIIGRVYHAENMPPFGLPGSKNISGLKSNSTLGGGGYNEYVMDDTKGNELIREHGQYDKDSTIEHDLREHVLHDRSRDVTNNETILIGNNRSKHVKNNETTKVDANRTETVGKDETITINGNRTETVAKDEKITINGGRTESVAKDEKITISGGRTENVAKDESITIGASRTESVSKNEQVTVGEGRTHSVGKNDTLSVGKVLAVTAGDQISFTTGKASIVMKKDGTILISGKDITITGSGKITGKATKDMVLKGKKILQN